MPPVRKVRNPLACALYEKPLNGVTDTYPGRRGGRRAPAASTSGCRLPCSAASTTRDRAEELGTPHLARSSVGRRLAHGRGEDEAADAALDPRSSVDRVNFRERKSNRGAGRTESLDLTDRRSFDEREQVWLTDTPAARWLHRLRELDYEDV